MGSAIGDMTGEFENQRGKKRYEDGVRLAQENDRKRLADIQEQQTKQASALRGAKQGVADNLRQQASGQLADEQRGLKSNLSSRGLLYGGAGEGQMARSRGAAAGRLGGAISGAHRQLEGQAQAIEGGAIDVGMQIQSAAQQAQNQMYSQALAQQNAQNSMIGGALGLIAAPFTMGASLLPGLIGGRR